MKGRSGSLTLSQHRVHQVLDYNSKTGVLLWRESLSKNHPKGSRAGGKNGYIRIDNESTTTARLVWFFVTGEWTPHRIKFLNGDQNDLRWENLSVNEGLPGKFNFQTNEGRNAYQKAMRETFKEKYRNNEYKYKYGLTLDGYVELVKKHDNLCGICGQPETHKRNGQVKALAVDHDHITGKVRGLLCSDCNTGIGKLKDDPEVVLKAYRYLLKNRDKPALQTGPTDAAQTTGRNLVQEV